jgi:hypothetical protein
MIFESKDNTYDVIRLLSEGEVACTYLCMCDRREYILLCVKDEGVQRSCSRLFLETIEQKNFDGLREIFSDGDVFVFAFFSHRLGMTLSKMTEEEFEIPIGKKLELLKQLLAGLCVHEIPVFVACDLFLYGNIGIDTDGIGNGYYTLMEPENFEKFDFSYFGAVLSDCIRKIFPREIKKNQYRELAEFCGYLENPVFQSFLEIYEAYTEMYGRLDEKLKKNGKQDAKSAEAGIEKVKKTVDIAKRILIIAILLAAFAVLVWSLKGDSSDGGGIYQYIGDITIEEYTGESTR